MIPSRVYVCRVYALLRHPSRSIRLQADTMSDISIMSRTCAEVDSNFRRRWGAFVATSVYGHYQQTVEYATLRQNSGWRARFVWKETEGQIAAGTLLLSKGLAGLGLGLGMGMMP